MSAGCTEPTIVPLLCYLCDSSMHPASHVCKCHLVIVTLSLLSLYKPWGRSGAECNMGLLRGVSCLLLCMHGARSFFSPWNTYIAVTMHIIPGLPMSLSPGPQDPGAVTSAPPAPAPSCRASSEQERRGRAPG